MGIYKDIIEKKATIAVIGLGYVGLPIALAFANFFLHTIKVFPQSL